MGHPRNSRNGSDSPTRRRQNGSAPIVTVAGHITVEPHQRESNPHGPCCTFTGAPMTTINTNEAALGIESFGDNHAPVVALAGRTTMPSWPDALSERPAACGRRAVRYYPRRRSRFRPRRCRPPALNPRSRWSRLRSRPCLCRRTTRPRNYPPGSRRRSLPRPRSSRQSRPAETRRPRTAPASAHCGCWAPGCPRFEDHREHDARAQRDTRAWDWMNDHVGVLCPTSLSPIGLRRRPASASPILNEAMHQARGPARGDRRRTVQPRWSSRSRDTTRARHWVVPEGHHRRCCRRERTNRLSSARTAARQQSADCLHHA